VVIICELSVKESRIVEYNSPSPLV
jgi:hypothetical protein